MLKLESLTKNTMRAREFFEDKIAFTMGPVELKSAMETEGGRIQIIDVRNSVDFDKNHIPSAISIPLSKLQSSLSELSKERISVVYCYDRNCHLAAKAAVFLAENGYPVIELEGGFDAWKEKDYSCTSCG